MEQQGLFFEAVSKSLKLASDLLVSTLADQTCRICANPINPLLSDDELLMGCAPATIDGRNHSALCNGCWHNIKPDGPILSALPIGPPTLGFTLKVSSGTAYTDPIKKLVRRYKYDHDLLLTNLLTQYLAVAWIGIEDQVCRKSSLIVPVPLHWVRRMRRGYNQAALLALALSAARGLPCFPGAMSRVRQTASQAGLPEETRATNLIQAFRAVPRLVAGKQIIIVDDVCTSGATMIHLANAALEGGAAHVLGLTVARALRESDTHACDQEGAVRL